MESDRFFECIQIYQRSRVYIYNSETYESSTVSDIQRCIFGKQNKVEEKILSMGRKLLRKLSDSEENYEN